MNPRAKILSAGTKNGAGTALSRHGYTLDGTGRRTRATRENGQRWDYGYDTLGQVTSAVKKFPDSAAIPGHTFSHQFDGIGNRTSAVHGGTGTAFTGTGVTYTPNELNQYTTIATQGGRFILGEAPLAYPVTINGDTANLAGGLGFYWKQLTGDNSSAPLWNTDTVASNGITLSGSTWTPKENVTPVHDFDGNLTSDGRWDYIWNAENRLTRMQTTAAAATAGVPRQRLDFVYDSQGRRISKTVSTSTDGTTWTFASNQRFLYDDWNLIAEYSAPSSTSTSLTLDATHTWGIDLSGSMQGAGGVGGLLATNLISQSPISNVPCFPAYDGNGNISAWIDSNGALLARMDYSPFGQLIAQYKFASDAALSRLRFGFSTKYTDAESGLLYYGFRYYDPMTGRWTSRDPIEEEGGKNVYAICGNNTVNHVDLLGMKVRKGVDNMLLMRLLAKAENEVDSSIFGEVSGLSSAIRKLKDCYRKNWMRMEVVYNPNASSSNWNVVFWFERIMTLTEKTPVTAVHESVHMYNYWINPFNLGRNDVKSDEGMAYALEAIYTLTTGSPDFSYLYGSDGTSGANFSDEKLRKVSGGNWRAMWSGRQYGMDGLLVDTTTKKPLEVFDFQKVQQAFGAKFSCKEISAMLSASPVSKRLCIKFSCDSGLDEQSYGNFTLKLGGTVLHEGLH